MPVLAGHGVDEDAGEQQWFEPDLASIADARTFAFAVLPAGAAVADEVELLVSELAANAVLHARSAYCVTVSIEPARSSSRSPTTRPSSRTLRRPEPSTPGGGRGLVIVDAIACRWGADKHPDNGKTTCSSSRPRRDGT